MDEILNKELLDQNDLTKYSPDYNPQDFYLRMQLRRELVKDKHNHVIAPTSWQRKNIKKSSTKTKKEIVKLRAYFQNKNLQNQCKVKNTNDRIKQNKYLRACENINHAIPTLNINDIGEIAICASDTDDGQVHLVIENDTDFKLKKKEKWNYLQLGNNHHRKFNKNLHNYDGNNKFIKDEPSETTSKISLINGFAKKSPAVLTSLSIEKNYKHENVICSDVTSPTCNEFKDDLQSLLIMMTIQSKIDQNHNQSGEPTHMESTPENGLCDFSIDVCDSSKHIHELSDNSGSGELTTLLNIKPITKVWSLRQKYIIKKYINLWKSFVNIKKENRMLDQRKETLNIFFNKLATKKNTTTSNAEVGPKSNVLARDYNTYRHRYKLQKHIIALQKAKLEEQNKLIEQLKYNKIVEASRQSLDTMREDIRKAYYDIDKHLKPKIKCLTNELKLKDFEEPSLVLHCLKVPQFLQRMEARAREREEKHAIIRERRKQMEEERIRLKQQAELAKSEMDKEDKIRKIKELRDKRKREKVENIRRKQHAERMRALFVMVDIHYEKTLLVKYGIGPFKRLIEIKRDNIEKAKEHYRFQTLKNIFLHWMWYTEDMWFERNYKAQDFYRKKILRASFNSLKKNHYEFILQRQVAEDYCDLYITQLVFRKFCEGIEVVKNEIEIKLTKATVYYNSNIVFKTFTCWRSLPALNALKREQDARKLKWRQKVLLVVPDYKPPED